MSFAAGGMGIITYISKELWFNANDPIGIRIGVLLACISLGMLVYAFISHLFKNEEWQFLLDLKNNKAKILPSDPN